MRIFEPQSNFARVLENILNSQTFILLHPFPEFVYFFFNKLSFVQIPFLRQIIFCTRFTIIGILRVLRFVQVCQSSLFTLFLISYLPHAVIQLLWHNSMICQFAWWVAMLITFKKFPPFCLKARFSFMSVCVSVSPVLSYCVGLLSLRFLIWLHLDVTKSREAGSCAFHNFQIYLYF
jgi:hypothetical protein